MHLELFGRRLDDDEYLIDCGCNPRSVNEITTVYLMPGERDIEIPQNSPDDNEEVPITINNLRDNQLPIQSPIRREIHQQTVQFNQNIPQQAGTTPDDEQPSTSYHHQDVPYQHQVDLDDSDEDILMKTPDSLGTPDVRREDSTVSHLVFTPIVKPVTSPSIQLESVHQNAPESPRELHETRFVIPDDEREYFGQESPRTVMQEIANDHIEEFFETSRLQRELDETIQEVINHLNPVEPPQRPSRVKRPPTVHPPGVDIRNTRPTIREDTRELIHKKAEYQLAKERAKRID